MTTTGLLTLIHTPTDPTLGVRLATAITEHLTRHRLPVRNLDGEQPTTLAASTDRLVETMGTSLAPEANVLLRCAAWAQLDAEQVGPALAGGVSVVGRHPDVELLPVLAAVGMPVLLTADVLVQVLGEGGRGAGRLPVGDRNVLRPVHEVRLSAELPWDDLAAQVLDEVDLMVEVSRAAPVWCWEAVHERVDEAQSSSGFFWVLQAGREVLGRVPQGREWGGHGAGSAGFQWLRVGGAWLFSGARYTDAASGACPRLSCVVDGRLVAASVEDDREGAERVVGEFVVAARRGLR